MNSDGGQMKSMNYLLTNQLTSFVNGGGEEHMRNYITFTYTNTSMDFDHENRTREVIITPTYLKWGFKFGSENFHQKGTSKIIFKRLIL